MAELRAEEWAEVERLFQAATCLPLLERAGFLARECGDASVRLEVASLLEHADEELPEVSEAIEAAARTFASETDPDERLLGARLGSYRLDAIVGHGGMGAVYRASRIDAEFDQQVALKLVRAAAESPAALQRFRLERQILARLAHPNIARLLDGGSTPEGVPYLVMEFIDGEQITDWRRANPLNVEDRLRLFLRVCEAVEFAHRNLVVHRDLKPSNILVTADGTPKLLDFGIAKLLDAGADTEAPTRTELKVMTPDYASPEQVRGLAVTTATDIYTLGAILYELLTGERAQQIDTYTPFEIERVVCQTEPPRPSLAFRGLHSDLDYIVKKAMRKEPERRYGSVDQFAADIQRHLDGLPVIARQGSLRYRAGKFARRNRAAIATAALVFGSLIGGIVVSTYQARQAVVARRLAEAQRQRAERRLTQMVELADRSLGDVHSAIEKLPGSTQARRQIVTTTLQFLQNLSRDAGQDDRLRLVLSEAYMKVADVQGDPVRANLGDSEGALENYRKSAALVEPLLTKEPNRIEYLTQWIEIQRDLAALLQSLGRSREGTDAGRRALPAAERLTRLCPPKADCLREEADLYDTLVFTLRANDPTAALGYSSKEIHSLQQILKSFPDDNVVAIDLATAYSQAAYIRNRQGELSKAVDLYRRAIDLREQAIRRNPANAETRRLVMITYGNLAGTLGGPFLPNLGDTKGAQENYAKALAIARELVKADADNQLAQSDLANALVRGASLDLPKEQWAASLSMLREGDAILQKLVAADPESVSKLRPLALAQEFEGHRLEELGSRTHAIAHYRQSLAIAERVLARSPSDSLSVSQALADEEALAGALAADGNRAAAVEMAQKAVSRAERGFPAPGSAMELAIRHRAEAYRQLGAVYVTFGDWRNARAAAERAVSDWRQLAKTGSKMLVQAEADQAERLLGDVSAHAR